MKTTELKIVLAVLLAGALVPGIAQEKIALYPPSHKVTLDGFDKERPFLEYFRALPDSAKGSAILICPGGAYTALAAKHEGSDVAQFFSRHGVDAFVLHYRLNNASQQGHRHPDQFNDVTRAMRLIKSRAAAWKIDPQKIGVMGFSAGGHLASMCGTMYVTETKPGDALDGWDSRPSFMVLIYPVISLSSASAHRYSAEMLLGKNPAPALLDSLSTQHRVTTQTPPAFLVYANDDTAVPPENGILFYQALRQENIPASLLIYDHGGHGFGMAPNDPVLNTWPELCIQWLRRLKFGAREKSR